MSLSNKKPATVNLTKKNKKQLSKKLGEALIMLVE